MKTPTLVCVNEKLFFQILLNEYIKIRIVKKKLTKKFVNKEKSEF